MNESVKSTAKVGDEEGDELGFQVVEGRVPYIHLPVRKRGV
jgi:hypothetical protein